MTGRHHMLVVGNAVDLVEDGRMVDLITDDMVDLIARAVWDSRTSGHEPRVSWDAAKTKLRYSHAATLRETRIALDLAVPMIAERLQDAEGGTINVINDVVARHQSRAHPGLAARDPKAAD